MKNKGLIIAGSIVAVGAIVWYFSKKKPAEANASVVVGSSSPSLVVDTTSTIKNTGIMPPKLSSGIVRTSPFRSSSIFPLRKPSTELSGLFI